MIPLSDPAIRRRRTPYVNIALIVANIAAFLYTFTLTDLGQVQFFLRFGVIPVEFTAGHPLTAVNYGETLLDVATPFATPWTLLTSLFIHGGIAHILGNMVFLWVFGDNVEDRMGHVGYALFYLASGAVASGAHILFNWTSTVPTVGASGAIAGVLGAYLLFYPLHRIRTLVIFFFIFVIELPAVVVLGFWAFIQIFNGLGSLSPVTAQTGGVAYWAHIGGFAMGMGLVALWRLLRGQRVWQPYDPPRYTRY